MRPQEDERHHLEADGEGQGRSWRHGTRDERAVLGALHQLVDVAVDDHVDGVGAAGGHRATEDRADDEPERRHPPLGDDHRGHRRDEQQLDDPRLRERDVVPDPGASRQPGVADTAGRLGPGPARRRTRSATASGARAAGSLAWLRAPDPRSSRLVVARPDPTRHVPAPHGGWPCGPRRDHRDRCRRAAQRLRDGVPDLAELRGRLPGAAGCHRRPRVDRVREPRLHGRRVRGGGAGRARLPPTGSPGDPS